MKPCRKCGAVDRNKRGDCIPCQVKHHAKWWKANSEKVKAYHAKYRAENSEKRKAYSAKWYRENPEKAKTSHAKWQTENPEKVKAANIKWRKANPEKIRAACAKYYAANPELWRIIKHNRRARKEANGGKLSNNLGEVLYAKQKGKCACCQEPLGDNYHLDHIQPLSRGGANEDWNIQLLKASCNRRKGAKDPVDYMQEKGFLI